MKWNYVKPLSSESLLTAYETGHHFKFPESYKKCIAVNNGGRPEKRTFLTSDGNERVMKSLLSFNPEDKENIWSVTEWSKKEISDNYLPFAMDNFGNLICFERSNAGIVFINLENMHCETIAESFDKWTAMLYL